MVVFLTLNGHSLEGDYAAKADLIAQAVALPSDRSDEAFRLLKEWLREAVLETKK
jgi:prophage maintenance system killer protein